MLKINQILLSAIVTEKSTFHRSARLNKYTFRVPVAATKDAIRKAVQDAFQVRVTAVATQRNKERLVKFKSHKGYTAEWKKAIVTLDSNHSIPI